MAQLEQYLQFAIGGVRYLLPAGVSLGIEQRAQLKVNVSARGKACAWREQGTERWPAYCLDRDFAPVQGEDWESAIYLRSSPHPVGLAANAVHLLGPGEAAVTPFRPPGAPPTRRGHVFNGAWVREDQRVVLLLEPTALADFLQAIGG